MLYFLLIFVYVKGNLIRYLYFVLKIDFKELGFFLLAKNYQLVSNISISRDLPHICDVPKIRLQIEGFKIFDTRKVPKMNSDFEFTTFF